MIDTNTFNKIEKSGDFTEVSFGIKAEGLPHIFGVLRNQLYTDKIAAVIREISCNAFDAHIAAGTPNEPFDVKIPTQLDSYFKVRDYGLGLSQKDIQEIFCFYGESTKRASNDFVGMLGIGAKSPFSYTDSFIINAFYDGVKTIYNAYIDESGIGKIAKMSSEPTTERNGTEIVVPVNRNDIHAFAEKAGKIYTFFSVKPKVTGTTITQLKAEISVNGWSYYPSEYRNAVAVMGNIGYEIDTDAIREKLTDEEKRILESPITIDFKIGDLQVSASREGLQYTEKTLKSLKDKATEISNNLSTIITDKFTACKTILEAKRMWGSINKSGLLRDALWIGKTNIKWNGIEIKDTYIAVPSGSVSSYNNRRKRRSYSYRIIKETVSYIDCSKDNILFYNDVEKREVMGRIKTYFEKNPDGDKYVYVVSASTQADKDTFEQQTSFDIASMEKLSAYEVSINTTTYSTGKKYSIYEIDYENLESSYRLANMKEFLTPVEKGDEPFSYIYVNFKNKMPQLGAYDNHANWKKLCDAVGMLRSFGLKKVRLFAVREGFVPSNSKKHIEFTKWFELKVTKLLKKKITQQEYENNLNYSNTDGCAKNLVEGIVTNKIHNSIAATSKFHTFLDIVEASKKKQNIQNYIGYIERLKQHWKIEVYEAIKKESTFEKDFFEIYPMLVHITSWSIGQHKKDIADYINLVDSK